MIMASVGVILAETIAMVLAHGEQRNVCADHPSAEASMVNHLARYCGTWAVEYKVSKP